MFPIKMTEAEFQTAVNADVMICGACAGTWVDPSDAYSDELCPHCGEPEGSALTLAQGEEWVTVDYLK